MNVLQIPVDSIIVGPRKRQLNQMKVQEIAESIAQVGLLNPLTVTPIPSHEQPALYQLVTGLHRLEAIQLRGDETVAAVVRTLDDLEIELAEIDENLVRHDLTVLQRGEHLKRRKEIYEARHPEAKVGGDRRSPERESKRNDFALVSSFAQEAASKTGVSQRTIQQEIQIAENLTDEVKDLIRETDLANHKTDLIELARVDEPIMQREVAEVAVSAKVPISDALRLVVERQAALEEEIDQKVFEFAEAHGTGKSARSRLKLAFSRGAKQASDWFKLNTDAVSDLLTEGDNADTEHLIDEGIDFLTRLRTSIRRPIHLVKMEGTNGR